jgi:hypothetical protein
MASNDDVFTIVIRKRSWWFWALALLWLALEVVFLQTALASVREGEYRAAAMSWVAAAVLAAAGFIAWFRRGGTRWSGEPNAQSE